MDTPDRVLDPEVETNVIETESGRNQPGLMVTSARNQLHTAVTLLYQLLRHHFAPVNRSTKVKVIRTTLQY